jgi:hypothetical protein
MPPRPPENGEAQTNTRFGDTARRGLVVGYTDLTLLTGDRDLVQARVRATYSGTLAQARRMSINIIIIDGCTPSLASRPPPHPAPPRSWST